MTVDPNDPRLTAYVLSELHGKDLETFEALLEEDADARALVEARRETAARLEGGLPVLEGEGETLGALPRARIVAAAGLRPVPAWRRPGTWARLAAACVLVAGLLGGASHLLRDRDSVDVDERPLTAVLTNELTEEGLDEVEGGGTRAIHGTTVTYPEPVIRDAELVDHVETDNDLPYEESRLTDASTSGPVQNRLIGLGGGVGAGPFGRPRPGKPAPPGWRLPATPRAKVKDSYGKGEDVEREPWGRGQPGNTEGYDRLRDNPFFRTTDRADSTFSIDVDTASYANVRRFLQQMGRLPPKDAVRVEELINYFPYDYPAPSLRSQHPFAYHAAVTGCPWAPKHRLVRVAIKGQVMHQDERPAANLVFLLDVSGSMNQPNKLPLVQRSMRMLLQSLRPDDRVAIVVYAGAAGLVLPSTAGSEQDTIRTAIDRLRAGGSTNGGAGIELAYRVAIENLVEGGVNRVILCTDGDFNVGISDRGSLSRMIEAKAKTGVFLTVLGFGMGNLKDGRMEELSNKGNGNYGYVDNLKEAKKLLVDQGLGTLVTIAKDVKIQVHFNKREVQAWRLIGYENRLLKREDFKDDTKDAGEIGAGHAVTAFYEVVPVGVEAETAPPVAPNPFDRPIERQVEDLPTGLLHLALRYKMPDEDVSTEMSLFVQDSALAFQDADIELQWAAAVAGFGMMLRDSPYKGHCSWPLVKEIAQAARGEDRGGYRAECCQLIQLAATLSAR